MIDLKNKTALVTGSGRGIGKEIARKFAKAGADVAISDIDLATAKATAEEIAAEFGCKTDAFAADVSKSADVEKLFKDVLASFGGIDILVNNAGITRDGLLMRMKEEDWDLVLSINLKSAFLCCKEAVRPMLKNGGKIINIASCVGLIGNAGQANYSASKAGMIGLTKTLAREFAKKSINVNAIAPGFIRTAMTDKLTDAEKEKLASGIPMAKLGEPEDVANAALFLASPLSDYMTGQVLSVDGGMVM